MSEIIAKLIDLIMPVVKGETVVNLRMKTFQQMVLWWFLLFIVQGAITVGFFYAWTHTRAWLGLPVLPSFWYGSLEEFFFATIGFFFLAYLTICVLLNAAYWPDSMSEEVFEKRSERIIKRYLIFLGICFAADLTYIWFKWDLYQRLTAFYYWLKSVESLWY